MSAKLKTPFESLIMRLFQRTVSSLLFDFLNNKQFPYMCIYMNMNVESHLPLAKNLLHLYLYCVCPFSQIRSSISSYWVSCELKLCPRPRSWQSDYSHLNGNLCCFSSLNRSPRKKNDRGNHLKLEEVMFCTQFNTVDAVSKTYGASFHWQQKRDLLTNCLARHNATMESF